MKKINKRKIVILIVLIIAIIVEVIAFGLSRGDNTKAISVTVQDSNGLLENQTITLAAIDDGASGYYVTLPNLVNTRFVGNYIVETQSLQAGGDTNAVDSNNTSADSSTNTAGSDTQGTNGTASNVWPGNKLYLTQDELDNADLTLNAAYDTKETDGQLLYNKKLQIAGDSGTLTLQGYMPDSAVIDISGVVDINNIQQAAEAQTGGTAVVDSAYNIKLMADGTEYNISDFNESMQISMSIDSKNSYILVSVGSDNSVTKITNYNITGSQITFPVNNLGAYAVLQILAASSAAPSMGIMQLDGLLGAGPTIFDGVPWDGSIGTSFKYGQGTQTFPYLITNGSDLAYLAQTVNSGTNYVGVYFQLTNDINLNGRAWTPIGTYSNSFRGIFDGAGHIISNAVITTAAWTTAVNSYGIFGSQGWNTGNGGTNYSEIRNLEIDNITISITGGTGVTNGGIHAGFVVGTMYADSRVENCIVKGCLMNSAAVSTTANAIPYIFLGGIAGSIGTPSAADPGDGHRYVIDNCYVSANIGGNGTMAITSNPNASLQISSGGIVGRIHNQQVWPTNCLYTGQIELIAGMPDAGGYVGPIFGSLRGDTTPVNSNSGTVATSTATDDKIWQGNDTIGGVASNLTMTSYYTNFVIKGTPFSGITFTSGTTPDTAIGDVGGGYRLAVSYTMSNFQGINKAIYTNDMNAMLSMFSTNASNSGGNYVSWQSAPDGFTFQHRLTASITEGNRNEFTVTVDDPCNINNYTYSWYSNGTLDSTATGTAYSVPEINPIDYDVYVIVYDGTYYSVSDVFIPKLNMDMAFQRDGTSLTAVLAADDIDIADCTIQWYLVPKSGGSQQAVSGANSLSITGVSDSNNYRIVITNNTNTDIKIDQTYNAVIVDNLDADLNYYYGLNYANSTDGTLPNGTNQNLYSTANLAKVMISYSGSEIFNSTGYTGTVSLTEPQSEYVYYDYYPIVNGQVKIPLIDNPFTNRPANKGFNNWVPNNSTGTISFDVSYYKRYITVPASSNITISLHASWVDADAVAKDGSNAWATILGALNAKGMMALTTSSAYTGQSMAGYYLGTTLTAGTSLAGYYDANENALSGSAVAGTTYYRLIQSSDADKTYNASSKYYYAVTRDTNIIYLIANLSGNWGTNQNTKPMTFTSVYNGVDYGATWTISTAATQAYSDLTIENMKIVSGSNASTTAPGNSMENGSIYGAYHNLKLGRGIAQNGSNTNFNYVIGGSNAASGTAAAPAKYSLIIESGYYNSIGTILTGVAASVTSYVNMEATYGNDYDRVNGNITNLRVYRSACPTWGGTIRGADTVSYGVNTIVKSGSFGTSKNDSFTGIYVGGNSAGNGTFYTPRSAVVQGGYIYCLVGGASTDSSWAGQNADAIYITGGSIDSVFGGAGLLASYGNRIISITGGTVNYSLFGGSNAYNGSTGNNSGTLNGSTFVYVGGNAQIGNSSYVTGNSTLWGAEAGSVFGIGNGTSSTNVIGSCDNSNVIIDGNANILRNVYGGGNYAAVGVSTTSTSTAANMKILGGTINGSVYGGGNRNGAGTATIPSAVNVNMTGGHVLGSVYGGSNITGTIYGGANVNLLAGTVDNNVYGGGQGGTTTGTGAVAGTFISQNVNVTIGSSVQSPTINGSVYGGSALGVVNGTARNTTLSAYNTSVTMQSGSVVQNIFGGGQGDTSGNANTTPYVCGNITVNVNGGTMNSVYGGNDQAGTPNGSVTVYLNGGTMNEGYGGGNNCSVSTTNIYLQGSKTNSIYGGSKTSGTVTTSNVTATSGTTGAVFGGNNAGGTVGTANVNMEGMDVPVVYGGNNMGGSTTKTNVNIDGGNISNVYGGGNIASTGSTNVLINTGTIGNAFGGGDAAEVTANTNLVMKGGTITANLYGGGNNGDVLGNSLLDVSGGTIAGNLYAGGNGSTAVVHGNTTLNVEGNPIIGTDVPVTAGSGCAFGGGNAAATGSGQIDGTIVVIPGNGVSTVNIVGGTFYGNVYGGANTSIIYGKSNVNIGYAAVNNTSLTASDIYIKGTVFGGGEANASGSPLFDYTSISVTTGINMNIDATGHADFSVHGSIFGSGDASTAAGTSTIHIKGYGTISNPQMNVSIQRANLVTMDNSAISLSGATDRNNDYSTTMFSLSRIDELDLTNNSSLYLDCGANLLQSLYSLVSVGGAEETAVIDDTGNTTRNVDNRIYMLQGKNLNIATDEQVTAFGNVNGMTFFGLFTSKNSPAASVGFYNDDLNNGDLITNEGLFSSNSYVIGAHKTNHDITVDGFYTNINSDGYVQSQYVGVTPPDDVFYMWYVGDIMDVTTFNMDMTASKYVTLGTSTLLLTGFSTPQTKLELVGFSSDLINGVSLVDKSGISDIASNSDIANSVFGLSIESGMTAWQTNNFTSFYTAEGGTYSGTTSYKHDNSTFTPSLNFYFYHSQNLSIAQPLGDVTIRFQALTPVDPLNYAVSYIDINVNLSTALFSDSNYEAAIAPGEKFDLFNTELTCITPDSTFSTYYGLFLNNFSGTGYYSGYNTDKHVLVSTASDGTPYAFKAGTTITMLDLVTSDTYYYIVTPVDESNGKYVYNLSDFIKMGSSDDYYNEGIAEKAYYDASADILHEKFIFHVDVSNSDIETDIASNMLLMELRNSSGSTLIGVLGIERETTAYSIYTNSSSYLNVNGTIADTTVYLGNQFNLDLTTTYVQDIVNTIAVFDTKQINNAMGIKITILDGDGNKLETNDLLGVTFTVDGITYYPGIDGAVRIKIADRLSNMTLPITINTADNTSLATGVYTIQIDGFASSDGIYYGLSPLATTTNAITIINGKKFGLKAATDDNSKIVDKTAGTTENGDNVIATNLSYDSSLSNPEITVSLKRRDYSSVYSTQYSTVDLADYVTDSLTAASEANEYIVSDDPAESSTFIVHLGTNLKTGTYKLTYKLYDGDTYIGEAYDYIVIK